MRNLILEEVEDIKKALNICLSLSTDDAIEFIDIKNTLTLKDANEILIDNILFAAKEEGNKKISQLISKELLTTIFIEAAIWDSIPKETIDALSDSQLLILYRRIISIARKILETIKGLL